MYLTKAKSHNEGTTFNLNDLTQQDIDILKHIMLSISWDARNEKHDAKIARLAFALFEILKNDAKNLPETSLPFEAIMYPKHE